MFTGVDIVELNRLPELRAGIRERFIHRVFTPREQACLGDNLNAYTLRFAAKEAVSKALGTGIGQVKWQDIEVLSLPSGAPTLELHGAAKARAESLGITGWSLSLSDSRSEAIAFVVAIALQEDER